MFEDLFLHTNLLKALAKLNILKPTPVQEEAIPLALTGKDLLVSAPTGSGKTASFLLPVLNTLLETNAPRSNTRVLVLVPTRELANQVAKQAQSLAAFTAIKSDKVVGGEPFTYQAAELRKNPEIVVGTPGRLIEHLDKGNIELSDIEVLILDEADRMLDMGFRDEVMALVDACPKKRQTLLFSATLEDKRLQDIIDQVLQDHESVLLQKIQRPHQNITQQMLLADEHSHKEKLLSALVTRSKYQKLIVFTNTRAKAEALLSFLLKVPAVSAQRIRMNRLHGEMSQADRNKVIQHLRRGNIKVVIATDVAARGLDIEDMDLVINFDVPRNAEDYIHRIGRTGRADTEGTAITMVSAPEWNLMASIQRFMKHQCTKITVKGLEGGYKGPKKVKSSGKAVVSKKKKTAKDGKTKLRHRDLKNKGKRRSASSNDQKSTG